MKIEKTQVFGFESALHGMRNAKNSWSRIDSISNQKVKNKSNCEGFIIGENDLKLAQTLVKAGTEHCKFMRQIQVWTDITMPRYWWQEFDTYKIGTTSNSTSTMHKLFDKNKKITLDLFEVDKYAEDIIDSIICELNMLKDRYFSTNKQSEKDHILRIAKQILPESYLNTRTINLNYATIRNIILQRKHHRLKSEWQDTFCKWVTTLPYSKELIFCGIETDYERLK